MKLFAILKNDIITDAWLAETIEEASIDNPGFDVIELTEENSPQYVSTKYVGSFEGILKA
jgi:hypothetical protein